jgi:1,4-dihydroxy-2-naphthoyl-CoA hydrolase
MSIWHAPFTVDEINQRFSGGLAAHLGIEVTAFGDDWIRGTMPVLPRLHQPMGLLHGGASVALAETLGSVGANLCVDYARQRCVGQEINANHIRGISEGIVTGTARAVHVGSRSQVWEIEIRNPAGQLVCLSRLTIAVVDSR